MSAKTFEEWLCKEMPPGTIIGDPSWWAPRIERQVRAALLADAPDVEALVKELRAYSHGDAAAVVSGEAAEALLAQQARIRELEGEGVPMDAYLAVKDRVKELEGEIAKLKGEWVSVAESMPDPFAPVVVADRRRYENADDGCGDRYLQSAAYWNPNLGGHWSVRGERAFERDAFTHWAPLPEHRRDYPKEGA